MEGGRNRPPSLYFYFSIFSFSIFIFAASTSLTDTFLKALFNRCGVYEATVKRADEHGIMQKMKVKAMDYRLCS